MAPRAGGSRGRQRECVPAAAAAAHCRRSPACSGAAAEAPSFDFESAFDRLAGARCRVERIMLVGLERTKRSVVEAELLRVKVCGCVPAVADVLDGQPCARA